MLEEILTWSCRNTVGLRDDSQQTEVSASFLTSGFLTLFPFQKTKHAASSYLHPDKQMMRSLERFMEALLFLFIPY